MKKDASTYCCVCNEKLTPCDKAISLEETGLYQIVDDYNEQTGHTLMRWHVNAWNEIIPTKLVWHDEPMKEVFNE
jgi:hypothetical protein